MPMNQDNTPILREMSARGATLLLSKGAETFDPDSMVEEAVPNDVAPVKSLPQPSILSLKIQPTSSPEPFEVAGLLQRINSDQGVLWFAFACLTPIAIELSHLAFLQEPSSLLETKIKTGESEEQSWEGVERMVLKSVSVSDFVGSTATVTLQFVKSAEQTA